MTTATTARPLTACTILFDSSPAEACIESLFRAHPSFGAVTGRRLSAGVHKALQHELSAAGANLLDLDVVDILVCAWKKHFDLVAAARRTTMVPGSSEVVELATHRVTSVHRPYIDLVMEDVRVGRVQLELQLIFVVRGLLAVVRDGALVAVRGGDCNVKASLAIEGLPVASREKTFDLPGRVNLGDGVPLLPEPSSV